MVKYMKIGSPDTALDVGEIKPMTAPFDPRFPNQNQTRYCFSGYLDFHRCKNRHSEQYEACQYFKKVLNAMCPSEWIEKWDDQLEQGTFQANI
ncbi:cytochrome c oxidase subunit 6B [Halictus rubicundus]|uniref:cytochrome c oxidase subunit 6B n=1 Tax=Halictus rubicundus TaxID=77578 RepID=UPI00403549BE